MKPDLKILVFTIGSAGDVHPFMGLAKELQHRGHQVALITSDYFKDDIKKAGLDFQPLQTSQDLTTIMDHPDLWHPTRGFKLLYQQVFVPLAPVVYQMIADRYKPGETGVVASTLIFGALMAQEKLRVPTVTVHLQPVIFRSVHDTPVYPGLRLGPSVPRWLKRALFLLMDAFVAPIINPKLNAFRRTLGLKPLYRIFDGWLNSRDCTIGLFPEWYAPPQPDWPSQVRLTGFPLFDSVKEHPLRPEVKAFLKAGEPPVTFTAGSAMKQGQWFFKAAMDACERLKCRGLLINRFRDQVPVDLPSNLCYADYVPFSQVFPRSRVVVHHGGIGTTAQVLAAGVPQVIVPISFDQFDQAMRIERIGAGAQIPRKQFEGEPLAAVLKQVLENPAYAERAQELAARMNGPRDIAMACDLIEQTFRRSVLSS